MMPETSQAATLSPYLPRLLLHWLMDEPDRPAQELDGSVVLVDISGFTKMSERLARKGKVGAEEVTDVLDAVFNRLLSLAYAEGGGLLKFGGDALLLFFSGDAHPVRAVRAATGMRRELHRIGGIDTSAGVVRLRMSIGIHSGRFQFFLVGNSHREFIISGPGASETVSMEATASASQILMSPSTARAVPQSVVGAWNDVGFLVRKDPSGVAAPPQERQLDLSAVDVSQAIPRAIRPYLRSGLVEPEHRMVSVGFLHYDGMDLLVTEEGLRSAALALQELVCDVQEAADHNGVTFLGSDVDRDGGKIILAAGVPVAVGDDEERMLLTLHEIVGRRRRLPVRLGVNLGPVFAGNIGPEYRRTYTIMGDAVNLAARLMSKAAPGQIIATRGVLAASGACFQVEPLPPFEVKGKAEPIRAFSVGPLERIRRQGERAEPPLVGREEELREIIDSVEALPRRSGRLLEIVGPPGIGKSRLLSELRTRSAGVKHVEAACELYGASMPYRVLGNVLRQAMGLAADASDDTVLRRVQTEIGSRATDLEPWLPLIAVAAGIDVAPTDEVQQLDDSFRKDQLERVVGAFLARLLDGPAVILIEDVHWMDELSSELLARLVSERLADAHWLICVTRRDVTSGFAAPTHSAVRTLTLSPLAPQDARLMVEWATDDMPLLPRDNEMLVERSGGNPLFLQELVRASREAGVEALPDSVEAVVTAQIDQLTPADRSLLRTAAVLGAVFDVDLLSMLLDDGADPLDASVLERLEEFVVPQDPGTWRFRHALIRDAAYEGLPYRRRRDLHAHAGRLIEEAADDTSDVAELLSLHYFNARRFRDAWRHSVIAGRRARDRFSNARAVEFFDRALEAASRLGDVDRHDVAEIREALGDVLFRMGDFRRARNVYRDVRRGVDDDPLATSRVLMKQAGIPERLGRYSDALRWLQRGWTVLQGMDGVDVLRQRAQLSVFYASIRVAQGRARDAENWCARAIEEAEASGEREALAHASYILDWALVLEGRAAGYENSDKALAIYRDLRDPAGQAVVLNNLGAFKYFDGDWDEAVVLYREGRDARERTGDPVNAAYGTCNIGEILADQGRLEEAEPMFQDARRVWRAAGDSAGVAFAESLLGRLASRAGRADLAMELFDRARATFVKVGSQTDTIEIDARVAECLVFQGRAEEALERVSAALIDAEALEGVSVQTPLLQRIRGYALMQMERREEAAEAFEASLAVAKAREAPYDVALTLRAMAQLARAQGTDASTTERRSDELLVELGVVAVPDVPGSATPVRLGSGAQSGI